MQALQEFAASFPDAAKDIRLNLQSVLGDSTLAEAQRFGVALACAIAVRDRGLRQAIERDGVAWIDEARSDDAQAAAALMAMNNVYYRFRHMIGKPAYASMPARLRMNRLGTPRTTKLEFELMCLAVSAIAGCELCVRSHEETLQKHGASEAQVHDAVRSAAVIQAASVARELSNAESAEI